MKYQQHRSIIGFSTAFFLALAPFAQAAVLQNDAESVDVGIMGGQVKSESQMKSGENLEIKGVRMEDGVNTAAGLKMEDRQQETATGSRERSGDDISTSTIGLENAEMHANANGLLGIENAEFHISLHEGSSFDKGTSTEINSVEKVESANDFEHFVAFKAKTDARLKQVDVQNGKVEVEYTEPAKLFGFIGMNLTARATVDQQGEVSVSYPWYHIFMKKSNTSMALQTQLSNAVKSEQRGNASVYAQASTTIALPNLFELMVNTLRASGESSTTASVQ